MLKRLKLLMLLLVLPSAACQTIVTTPIADCAGFIPDRWRAPVPGVALPAPIGPDVVNDQAKLEAALKGWMQFGVGQSGQLEKANGRTGDTIFIVEKCEARANAARPRKKILGIF